MQKSINFFEKLMDFFKKLMSFLGFPQILHDNAHFLFQKAVAIFVVAHGFQFGHECFVAAHPPVKGLEGGGRLAVRTVKLGQLGLGVGS